MVNSWFVGMDGIFASRLDAGLLLFACDMIEHAFEISQRRNDVAEQGSYVAEGMTRK